MENYPELLVYYNDIPTHTKRIYYVIRYCLRKPDSTQVNKHLLYKLLLI